MKDATACWIDPGFLFRCIFLLLLLFCVLLPHAPHQLQSDQWMSNFFGFDTIN